MKIPLILMISLVSLVARGRVVTVDFDRLLTEYGPTRAADQELQESIDRFRQEQQGDVAAYQELQQEFVKVREGAAKLDLGEEGRKELADRAVELITGIREKEQELQQKQQGFQREIEEQRRRLRQRLTDELREKIGAMARERDWELVLDKGALSPNGTPMVLHAGAAVDVTAEILREVNRPAEEAQPPPPAP